MGQDKSPGFIQEELREEICRRAYTNDPGQMTAGL